MIRLSSPIEKRSRKAAQYVDRANVRRVPVRQRIFDENIVCTVWKYYSRVTVDSYAAFLRRIL